MGKYQDKMTKALEIRRAGHDPKIGKTPGSMNKKKTGYRGVKAKGPK